MIKTLNSKQVEDIFHHIEKPQVKTLAHLSFIIQLAIEYISEE